jgi:hypothetical protein
MSLIGKTINCSFGRGVVIRMSKNVNFLFVINSSNRKIAVPEGTHYEIQKDGDI